MRDGSFSHTFINLNNTPFYSNDTSKEERPELVKKVYKWNTKEEAKQAFKELLKEKVRALAIPPPPFFFFDARRCNSVSLT